MQHRSIVIASVLVLLLSTGFAAAQRGGDDTSRPGEPGATNANPPVVPEDPAPPEGKPPAPPAKAFADTALPELIAWRPAKAKQILQSKQQQYQGNPYFDTAWGFLLAEERQLDAALTALEAASKAETKDPVAPYLLGEVQSWKGNTGAAKTSWENARARAAALVGATPNDARAQYWLGASLVRLEQFDAARTHLAKALEKGFSPAMTEYQIGLAFSYQRRWPEARDAFNRSIAADSGFAHAYYYRGRVWKMLGNTEQMLLDMDRFLKLAPDAREANAARSLLNAGG